MKNEFLMRITVTDFLFRFVHILFQYYPAKRTEVFKQCPLTISQTRVSESDVFFSTRT